MIRFNEVTGWIIMGLATLGIINILVFLYEASKYQ